MSFTTASRSVSEPSKLGTLSDRLGSGASVVSNRTDPAANSVNGQDKSNSRFKLSRGWSFDFLTSVVDAAPSSYGYAQNSRVARPNRPPPVRSFSAYSRDVKDEDPFNLASFCPADGRPVMGRSRSWWSVDEEDENEYEEEEEESPTSTEPHSPIERKIPGLGRSNGNGNSDRLDVGRGASIGIIDSHHEQRHSHSRDTHAHTRARARAHGHASSAGAETSKGGIEVDDGNEEEEEETDALDRYAARVIRDEDKLGVLSFGTDRLLGLLVDKVAGHRGGQDWKGLGSVEQDRNYLSLVWREPPTDVEAAYAALCRRREAMEAYDHAGV